MGTGLASAPVTGSSCGGGGGVRCLAWSPETARHAGFGPSGRRVKCQSRYSSSWKNRSDDGRARAQPGGPSPAPLHRDEPWTLPAWRPVVKGRSPPCLTLKGPCPLGHAKSRRNGVGGSELGSDVGSAAGCLALRGPHTTRWTPARVAPRPAQPRLVTGEAQAGRFLKGELRLLITRTPRLE